MTRCCVCAGPITADQPSITLVYAITLTLHSACALTLWERLGGEIGRG